MRLLQPTGTERVETFEELPGESGGHRLPVDEHRIGTHARRAGGAGFQRVQRGHHLDVRTHRRPLLARADDPIVQHRDAQLPDGPLRPCVLQRHGFGVHLGPQRCRFRPRHRGSHFAHAVAQAAGGDVGVAFGGLAPAVGGGRVGRDELPAHQRRSRVIDRSVACGSTTASTVASTSSGDSRAGQPNSAAIARARGQSSQPSASAAQVRREPAEQGCGLLPECGGCRAGAVQREGQLVGEELRSILVELSRPTTPSTQRRPARASDPGWPDGRRPARPLVRP